MNCQLFVTASTFYTQSWWCLMSKRASFHQNWTTLSCERRLQSGMISFYLSINDFSRSHCSVSTARLLVYWRRKKRFRRCCWRWRITTTASMTSSKCATVTRTARDCSASSVDIECRVTSSRPRTRCTSNSCPTRLCRRAASRRSSLKVSTSTTWKNIIILRRYLSWTYYQTTKAVTK